MSSQMRACPNCGSRGRVMTCVDPTLGAQGYRCEGCAPQHFDPNHNQENCEACAMLAALLAARPTPEEEARDE
jgi:hypothetical protein